MFRFYAAILISIIITLSGCNGGSNGTPQSPADLKVTSITPASGANTVARDGSITVIFSNDILANTVNNVTFTVKDDQSNSVEAESIIVSGNQAVFKPKIKLNEAMKHTVTISSEIKGLNGEVMVGSLVSNFTTQKSQWSSPEQFAQSRDVHTVIDNRGNAITVWWRYNEDNSHYEIVMSQLLGGVWSEPKVISGNATNVYNPCVAMDNNGNAIIVWNDLGSGGIEITEFRNGVWSEPFFINMNLFKAIFPPSVAMNDNGKAIIVWSQDDIFKSEYNNGAWSQPVAVSVGGHAKYPNVLINNSGNTIITWLFANGSYLESKLFCKTSQNGNWTAPQIISVVGKDPGPDYSVAFNNNNNAIVVWEQIEGNSYRVYRNEYLQNNWTGPLPVNSAGGYTLSPRVTMDNNGNAIVSWQQTVNYVSQVYISELKTGLWNTPTQVNTPGSEAAWPLIKMDNSGNAILLWNQADGTDWQLYRSQYVNGIWSEKSLLAVSHNQLNYVTYDIGMDGSGDTSIVWSQCDGTDWLLYRNQYH